MTCPWLYTLEEGEPKCIIESDPEASRGAVVGGEGDSFSLLPTKTEVHESELQSQPGWLTSQLHLWFHHSLVMPSKTEGLGSRDSLCKGPVVSHTIMGTMVSVFKASPLPKLPPIFLQLLNWGLSPLGSLLLPLTGSEPLPDSEKPQSTSIGPSDPFSHYEVLDSDCVSGIRVPSGDHYLPSLTQSGNCVKRDKES